MPSTELSGPVTPTKLEPHSRPASPGQSSLSRAHQAKFTSPAPPTTSSITPPPSSQIPITRNIMRTPTPPDPQLTSPPPTSKFPAQPAVLVESAAALYSADQVSNASPDELRSMVEELSGALRDVRLSAAHYKLQYNMAVMEHQETQNRMAVELTMTQRELDVLQQAEEKRRNTMASPVQSFQPSPVDASNAIMVSELTRQCQILENQNEGLRHMFDEQKRLTEHREGELAGLMEENDRLKTRIRRNRDHIAPLLEQMNESGSPRSLFGTPYQSTPRNRPNRVPPHLQAENSRGQNNFEALLMADKMLSQATATAPSTPTRSHAPRNRFGHNRGTHSMSSLPQTPDRRTVNAQVALPPRTPSTFAAVNIPQSAPPAHYQQKVRHARRESSNSTITASSVDEEALTEREDNDEVPESQASQAATSMLRRAAGSSSHMSAPSSQASHLVQSKIFGQVKKGSGSSMSRSGEFEKRRLHSSEHHGSPTKKGRIDRSSVGLGIGGLLRD